MGYGYGPGWGLMGGGWGGYGWGFGVMHAAVSVAVIVGIVFLVIWAVRSTSGRGALHARRSAGLDVLEERYARGEINRDEYLLKKKDIAG